VWKRPSGPAFLIALSGLGIGAGACLPWMYYFAGLIPLRGVIGLHGRLLLATGALCVALGVMLARGGRLGPHRVQRSVTAALGVAITGAAVWLLLGVKELARGQGATGMLAMRAGPGLFVVGLGGMLLLFTACIPETYWSYPASSRRGTPVLPEPDSTDDIWARSVGSGNGPSRSSRPSRVATSTPGSGGSTT
jgi:hypothetical protein